jgi:hypothetical protein
VGAGSRIDLFMFAPAPILPLGDWRVFNLYSKK